MEYIKRTALMFLFLAALAFCCTDNVNASTIDTSIYVTGTDKGNDKGKDKGKDKDKGPTTPVPAQEDIGGGYAIFN